MATIDSTKLQNTYQTYFAKQLLEHAVQELVLDQFGKKAELPAKSGSKTIRWFMPNTADASQVKQLSEGVPISDYREISYSYVEATLEQYGEAAKITDVATMTALLDALKQSIETMGEDCALFADNKVRGVLTHPSEGLSKRYPSGIANFDALKVKSNEEGKLTAKDILDAVTQLKINRAKPQGAGYVAVVCPQVQADLIRDSDLLDPAKYQNEGRIAKGEIGMVWGARIVSHTNPKQEIEQEGAHSNVFQPGNVNKTGFVYSTYVLGKDAYGIPKLSGTQSPFKPSIIINDKPDSMNPLNQFMTVGWKAFWAAKVLDKSKGITLRSKATFKQAA